MSLNAGTVEARLAANFDPHGFRQYDQAIEKARREKAIKAHLGGDLDPRAFKAYEEAADRARKTAANRKAFKAALGADFQPAGFREYDKATRQVNRGHDDIVHSSGRVRTAFGSLWLRGGAAFAAAGGAYGLYAAVKGVIGAYSESQKVGAQTEQVLKSTGGAAHVTAKHVGELATAISKKSGFDDEAVQSGANLLLTFTGIRNEAGKGNKVFDQATGLIADMSRALGQDFKSSAIQMGKALNDPIKGVTALQRVGVSFTQSQKDTIKQLVETGHKVQAQKLILGELRKEFGGSAAAYGKTLPGALDKAKVAFGNVAESIGKRLAPWLTKGANYVSKLFDQFDKGKGPLAAAGRFIGDVATKLGGFVRRVADAIGGGGRLARIFDNVKKAFSGFSAGGFVSFLSSAIPKVIKFGSEILGSKAGLVLMHGAIGALVGRTAALAAVWAVGKVVAFAGAIGKGVSALVGLRRGITLTSAAMKATPWGAIGTVIGIVAGALGVFSGGEHKAKVSADDLTDALHNQADALRGLRDSDLDAAQAHAALKSANVSLELAEKRVNDLRKAGKLNTIEGRQAEADLSQARVAQQRATRDVGDIEANTSRKRSDATKTTRDAIKTTKDRISTLQGELKALKFIGAPQDMVRKKQKELNDTMRALPRLQDRLNAIGNSARNQRPRLDAMRSGVDLLAGSLRYIAARNWVAHVTLEGVAQAARTLTNLAWQAAHIHIPHKRLGGKVGPTAGGAKLFIAGEGRQDEWVISQEGDRGQNIAWAKEALETLTGRHVGLHRSGHRRSRRPAPWSDLNPKGAGVAAFGRIWDAVRGLFPRAPDHYPGRLYTKDTGWVAWATDPGRQVANDPKGMFLIPEGLLTALATGKNDRTGWGLDPWTIGKLLVHEMAHSQQNPDKVSDAMWKSEGGAEAFARQYAERVMRRAGFRYRKPSGEYTGDPYNPYVRRVLRAFGQKWVDRMQFLAEGGRVGPFSGGARLFVAGEGDHDEWVISQEGDRRSNIAWALEALEALTGRTVELFRDGKPARAAKRHPRARYQGPSIIINKYKKQLKAADRATVGYDSAVSRKEHELNQLEQVHDRVHEDVTVQHDDGSVTVDENAYGIRKAELEDEITKHDEIKGLKEKANSARQLFAKVLKELTKNRDKAKPTAGKTSMKDFAKRIEEFQKKVDRVPREIDLEIGDEQNNIKDLQYVIDHLKDGTKGPDAAPAPDEPSTPDPSTPDEPATATEDPNLAAQLAQAQQRADAFQAQLATQEAAIGALRGPGDIGTGGPSAFAAAYDYPQPGQGNVYGAANPYAPAGAGGAAGPGGAFAAAAGLGGLEPGTTYIVKAMPIDDPQGQQQLAGAVNAGNGYQGYRSSSVEIPGI